MTANVCVCKGALPRWGTMLTRPGRATDARYARTCREFHVRTAATCERAVQCAAADRSRCSQGMTVSRLDGRRHPALVTPVGQVWQSSAEPTYSL
jgi:hypothetical protein